MLLLTSKVESTTRIDLINHQVVSYQKPVIIVDDFIESKLRFDFADQIEPIVESLKEHFLNLMHYYQPAFREQVDAYVNILNYVGITVVPFHNDNMGITIHPTSTIRLIDRLKAFSPHTEILATSPFSFYTGQQFLYDLCSPLYLGALHRLYDNNIRISNETNLKRLEFCAGLDLDSFDLDHSILQYPRLVQQKAFIRSKRWDSSYVCGWPLVSSAAKFLGGECTTNIDLNSLKTTLNTIQKFSNDNTQLISDVEKQLKMVNERVNTNYKLIQDLVVQLNANTNQTIGVINQLHNEIKSVNANLTQAIQLNTIANHYSSVLFRLNQFVVDFRFRYIETLDSFINHIQFSGAHYEYFDPELLNQLDKIGYTIPRYDNLVPYSYSSVRYLPSSSNHFSNIEFTIFIPVVQIASFVDNNPSTTYRHATLSPLPVNTNNRTLIPRYSGPAICNETTCYITPLHGFCRYDTINWYCSSDYFNTLTPLNQDFMILPKTSSIAMYIPPQSVYFSDNIEYTITDNGRTSTQVSPIGSLLHISCTTSLLTHNATTKLYIGLNNHLNCQDTNFTNRYLITEHLKGISLNRDIPQVPLKSDRYIAYQDDYYSKLLNDTIQNISVYKLNNTNTDQPITDIAIEIQNKLDALEAANIAIHDRINSMKSISSTPTWFYFAIFILLIVLARMLRLI